MRTLLIYILVGVGICAVVFCIAQLLPISRVATNPGAVRYRNTVWIGNALRRYQIEHEGLLPNKLSELVPKFIAISNSDWFFWPPIQITNTTGTNALAEVQQKIDNQGAFIYLGSNGATVNVVLYERPELWATNRSEVRLTVLTTNDFTPKFQSASYVEEKLRSIGR
jgi:hypothetical protein